MIVSKYMLTAAILLVSGCERGNVVDEWPPDPAAFAQAAAAPVSYDPATIADDFIGLDQSPNTSGDLPPLPDAPAMDADRRMLTLDVIGVGLSVEMFRQGDVWKEMQKARHFHDNVLPESRSPRWRHAGGPGVLGKRRADTLELALKRMVEAWPIPSVAVLETTANDWLRDTYSDQELREMDGSLVDGLRMPAGLHWTQIKQLSVIYSDSPEDVVEALFRTFERHPDLPAILVYVEGPHGKYDEPERSLQTPLATYAAMVVARRERVEWLRPWAPYTRMGEDTIYPGFWKWAQTPPVPFKPTPFFPTPWTRGHFKQWDALPTLARLHRPVVTRLADESGTPLTRPAQHAALLEGWKAAAGESYIDKVFFDTGNAGTGLATLSPVLRELEGSPDLLNPKEGIDLFARLGETGAASPFVQLVLATMASAESGRAGMVVPMRRAGEVTMMRVTPSDDEIPPYTFNVRLLPQTSQAPDMPEPETPMETGARPAPVIDPQVIAARQQALDDWLRDARTGRQ